MCEGGMNARYTEAQDAIIREGYAEGLPTRLIAKTLGRGITIDMVIGRAHRLHLVHKSKWGRLNRRHGQRTAKRNAIIREQAEIPGANIDELADAFGISAERVHDIILCRDAP